MKMSRKPNKFDASIVKCGAILRFPDDPRYAKPFDHALEDVVQLYRDAGETRKTIRESLQLMAKNVF
jgi:hypothetical protein